MNCPKCKTAIHEMRLEGVDFDFCSSCKGMWFDRDELAFMMELKKDIPYIEKIKEAAKRTAYDCPRCGQKLEELKFDSLHNLLFDRCLSCHGIWLDKGELAKAENISAFIGDARSKILMACRQLRDKGYQILGVRII